MHSLKYVTVIAVLPLLLSTAGIGIASQAHADSSMVCGLQLCSDILGGRAAWVQEQTRSIVAPSTDETVEQQQNDQMAPDEMDVPTVDKQEEADQNPMTLRLSRTNVPAEIPMHMGYYDGQEVYFIITDSSDPTHADIITESQGWQVELAPMLKNAPAETLSRTYMFVNGIPGDGVHQFQAEVFTSTPEQAEAYSPLTAHVHVVWNDDAKPRILDSETMIMDAEADGEVMLIELPVVINMPMIVWPGGQMPVKEDTALTDETPYGGAQVLEIDTEEMTVTFVAHRGWGPDGRTIYYIVTDATPSGPADMMGVVNSPKTAGLIANSAAVDLFQFKNGLIGSGPLGFQPGIASSAPGDEQYSPMWRIYAAEWSMPQDARLLETIGDLNAYREAGMISIDIVRPMDSNHIVNCPFIDPFQ